MTISRSEFYFDCIIAILHKSGKSNNIWSVLHLVVHTHEASSIRILNKMEKYKHTVYGDEFS